MITNITTRKIIDYRGQRQYAGEIHREALKPFRVSVCATELEAYQDATDFLKKWKGAN